MFDHEPIKVCPECSGEYRPEIERCADCGVPLVHPEEIAARDARELPRSPGLIAVRTAPIEPARALLADLAREGIRYHVDRRRAREEGLLAVYVQRQDAEAAKTVAEVREEREDPFVAVPQTRREAPRYKVCPECGGEYRPEIERCADCGIVLVSPEGVPRSRDEDEDEDDESPAAPESDFPDELPVVGPLHALPASDDLVCVCCRLQQYFPKLSLALDEAGIPHRFEPAPFAPPKDRIGCLYVQPADGDAAAAVDAGLGIVNIDDLDLLAETRRLSSVWHPAPSRCHRLQKMSAPARLRARLHGGQALRSLRHRGGGGGQPVPELRGGFAGELRVAGGRKLVLVGRFGAVREEAGSALGAVELFLRDIGSGQVGSGQVGSGQIGSGQIGPGQVGPGQVGPGQVGLG